MELKKKTVGTGGHIDLLYAKDLDGDGRTLKKPKTALPVVVPSTLDLFTNASDSINGKRAAEALKFLNTVRGINSIFLMRYGVGMAVEKFLSDSGQWEDQLCVTFPWMMPREVKGGQGKSDKEGEMAMEIIRIKYR